MSAAGHGRLSRSATILVAKQANGFHLLRIDGYSLMTKTMLPGQKLSSQEFTVGGYTWRIDYYPNGRDASASHNAISIYLQLTDHYQQRLQVQARYSFSLLDHGGNPAYELPTENGSFTSVAPVVAHHNASSVVGTFGDGKEETGCGYEEFIGKDDLQRRGLINGDSILVRCNVGVTEIVNSWLAQDELNALDLDDGEASEEEGYEAPGSYYGAPRRRRHRRNRRADDNEYVKWCLAQRADNYFLQ